jgi:hypothetical protein
LHCQEGWWILEHPPYSPDMSLCDERIIARDMLQHKRGDCSMVTAGHQRKWTCWWCTKPSTNLAGGGTHWGGGGHSSIEVM